MNFQRKTKFAGFLCKIGKSNDYSDPFCKYFDDFYSNLGSSGNFAEKTEKTRVWE